MGAQISKRYSSYKSQPKAFKLFFWIFFPMVPPKLWDFWNFGNWYFNEFLALLDYVRRAHEIEIHSSSVVRPSSVCGIDYLWSYRMDFFQILVVASPGSYPQKFIFTFEKKKYFLQTFFLFVSMGPYGTQNFKTLLLPQITFESSQTFSELSSQWSWQTYWFWIFEILIFRFLTNFLISPLYSMGKPKTSTIWKPSDRSAKRGEIWASGVRVQCIQGTFDT